MESTQEGHLFFLEGQNDASISGDFRCTRLYKYWRFNMIKVKVAFICFMTDTSNGFPPWNVFHSLYDGHFKRIFYLNCLSFLKNKKLPKWIARHYIYDAWFNSIRWYFFNNDWIIVSSCEVKGGIPYVL